MKVKVLCLFLIFLFQGLSGEVNTIKVKVEPDFPEGLPPVPIIWNGIEIAETDPGKSVAISIDLKEDKQLLCVGEAKVNLWMTGSKLNGEIISGSVKMKKGPTLEVKSKLSPEKMLINAMDYLPLIKTKLEDPQLSTEKQILYNRLMTNIINFDFTTENIAASVTGVDPAKDMVFLSFSYFGTINIAWNDTVNILETYFAGKVPLPGNRAQVFADNFSKIQKVGILKISQNGELNLTSVKTQKYKWGTYKKDKKTKSKYIQPMTFYVKNK